MTWHEAYAYLKNCGWTVKTRTESTTLEVYVWTRLNSTLITLWYPGREQWELFESSGSSLSVVAA